MIYTSHSSDRSSAAVAAYLLRIVIKMDRHCVTGNSLETKLTE